MLSFPKRLLLLILLFVVGLSVTGLFSYFIVRMVPDLTAAMRISAVVQDLLAFVLPAIVLALLVSRLPARFLQLNRPRPVALLLAALAVVASIPMINSLVAWNSAIDFGPLQQSLQQAEASAEAAAEIMLGGSSVADLVMGLLIVGVLAGLSEELFFRGALQRLLMTRPMNPHVAIWLTAFIFSAIHVQFFGFVPRLVLGAMFGYVAWWSGSVWPAVVAHVVNNSVTVTVMWFIKREALESGVENFGAMEWAPVCLSVAATTLLLVAIRNSCAGK